MFVLELIINIIYFILALTLPGKIKQLNIEITRKISHILCGNWIFIFAFFNNYGLTSIITMIFMIFLMSLSYKYNIFKGVERTNQIKSYGTIYFFVSLLILTLLVDKYEIDKYTKIIYFIPLIYGDAIAAIIGKKFNWIEYTVLNNKKTVSGNIGMLLTSFIMMNLYNFWVLNSYYDLLYLLFISVISTIIEAVSIKGTDNFTIPIITMFICEVIL